jgi:hypothetical protein
MLPEGFVHFADIKITPVGKGLGIDNLVDWVSQRCPKPDVFRGDKSHLVVSIPYLFG